MTDAALIASSLSSFHKHPPCGLPTCEVGNDKDVDKFGDQGFIKTPTTLYFFPPEADPPSADNKAAATDESTPPDMAT